MAKHAGAAKLGARRPLGRSAVAGFLLAGVQAACAQTGDSPANCRTPATEDERTLATAAERTLASLDAFIADLEARLAEFEEALAQPDAGPELVEMYRRARMHLQTARAQHADFAELAAIWCRG